MNVSLIITTYNWKEALELSLLSGLKQKKKPTEIIVADDGSRPDTG
ncbi:MAG: glycosyltransferase, partial [Candidatus Electrothrix sp. ATG2]|nr:glycosyltransferase [Candidatus Electrothrix sp. ATG2]